QLSRRLLEALGQIFRIPVEDLAAASVPLAKEGPRPAPSFARTTGAFTAAAHAPPAQSEGKDPTVRALFYGGRDASARSRRQPASPPLPRTLPLRLHTACSCR